MIRSDFHTHTTFCDGKSSVEEMCLSAVKMNMKTLGFSGHCHMEVDEEYYMSKTASDYRAEVNDAKNRFAESLEILCGIEQDYYADTSADGYDYIIGSVHYLKHGKDYISVDHSEEMFRENVKKHFDGDYYAFVEEYFSLVGEVVEKTGADIIGHFDLVTKFNEGDRLFDTKHPRYVSAWKAAVDRLLKHNTPFEINTGAISRGYRSAPYPSDEIVKYIAERGGRFVLNSDSHSDGTICYQFDKWEEHFKSLGIEFLNK